MIRVFAAAAILSLAACVSTPVSTGSTGVALTNQAIPARGSNINSYRRSAGLSAIARSARLDAAARGHAADMASNNFFAHRGSNGTSHTRRIRAQGCSGGAENIAEGRYTRSSVMAAWMASPGHRRNILLPAVTHYGIGNVGNKWVLTLSRNCS